MVKTEEKRNAGTVATVKRGVGVTLVDGKATAGVREDERERPFRSEAALFESCDRTLALSGF